MNRLGGLAALPLVFLAAGCSKKEPIGGTSCAGAFLPGDLAVSEIFANPVGEDGGKEWFEIYNASSDPATLDGLTLVTSKNDKTGEKKHRVTAATLAPGGYFVFGGVARDALPSFVDYGYGDDLGDLRNTSGRIALLCGSLVIDEVSYATVPEDASRALGASPPDAIVNDDDGKWCQADLTPGAANPSCTPIGLTTCLDGETERPLVVPAAGDLVISEWMPNPKVAGDTAGEWFEITVLRDVDLNGVDIGTDPGTTGETLGDAHCLRRTAGSQVLFARSDMAALNGGLPVVDFMFGFGLANGSGSIFVRAGGVVLDAISYAATGDGVSTQVDATKIDPLANDVVGNVCPSVTMIGAAGDKGTPGAANRRCVGIIGGCAGNFVAGDLAVSEIFADPAGTDAASKEWFEVANPGGGAANLAGLTLLTSNVDGTGEKRHTVTAGQIAAGDYFVFGGVSGALPASVDYGYGDDLGALRNTAGRIALLCGEVVVDEVTYATVPTDLARALDGALEPDAVANDDDASWCPLAVTPGAPNPSCVPIVGDTCLEGGVARPLEIPVVGDLVITEVMANPSTTDPAGEWFEVLVKRDVDLNGLQVGSDLASLSPALTSADCLAASAGSYLIFARSPNDALPRIDHPITFQIVNSNRGLVVARDDELLDAITYTTTTEGVATSLSSTKLTSTENDAAASFCPAVAVYGGAGGDMGSPGAANPACPAQ